MSSSWIDPLIINQCPPSLYLVIFFILRSILSDMRIAAPAFFCFPFACNIFLHPLTFGLYASLDLKWVSCRQCIYGSCSFIHAASLCLLVGAFSPFAFKVIIDVYLFIYCWQRRRTCAHLLFQEISHASKVMFKILQALLQQYVNHELPDVQAGF